MSINSRNKGAAFERQIANALIEDLNLTNPVKRILEQTRTKELPDLMLGNWCIECKAYGTGADPRPDWWDQVLASSQGINLKPALVYKFNNRPIKVRILASSINNKIKNITNIHDYQTVFKNLVELMIDQTCNQINYEGIENILSDDAYLFISNHRDITLDSTLLNYYLHQNNFKTTLNAVGNNLMNHKWASDLMRLNKSFIIQRDSVSQREIYKSLNLASEFICKSI